KKHHVSRKYLHFMLKSMVDDFMTKYNKTEENKKIKIYYEYLIKEKDYFIRTIKDDVYDHCIYGIFHSNMKMKQNELKVYLITSLFICSCIYSKIIHVSIIKHLLSCYFSSEYMERINELIQNDRYIEYIF